MKKRLFNIYYSFPIQLLVLHLRSNIILLFVWILLGLLLTGQLARMFGIRYLFLIPEYQGEVSAWSYLLLGMGFGAFFITWNLTSYLLDAHHFPFLASLARPFTKFCLNNFIIPLMFTSLYLGYSIYFQAYSEYWKFTTILIHCLAYIVGILISILLTSIYLLFTNKDIFNFYEKKDKRPPHLLNHIAPGRNIGTRKALKSGVSKWRVDTYLTEKFKPRLVRKVEHYDLNVLQSVFKQNHLNALLVQLISIIALVVLGLAIDHSILQIPAAASIYLLASVIVSITGAISYWFNKWSIPLFIIGLFILNYLSTFEIFIHKNKAYGLDYKKEPVTYTYQNLVASASPQQVQEDKQATIAILENWKKKVQNAPDHKPKMVLLAVSGGGMKAAVWSMQVLQQSDSLLKGQLLNHTTLITGASGGLLGTAYWREILLRKKIGQLQHSIYDPIFIEKIGKDLLNSLTFTIISNDLFLPWSTFEVNGHRYYKDRGYIFEKQLSENTDYFLDKPLGAYAQVEREALIPMLFVTPSIVNDGRRLIVSPHRLSYMVLPPVSHKKSKALEVDAVDFMSMFKSYGADQIPFTTALRMNATYPYILPNVYLPTQPAIEVMDAGFRDNYGIMSTTRFIHVFKDWIKENTSGVVVVQVIGRDKIEEIDANDNQGVISSLLNPLGIPGQLLSLQEYEQDTNLGYIYDLLGEENLDVVRFIYRPSQNNEMASMTFHLTRREIDDIKAAYFLPENQKSLKRLIRLMNK